MTSKKKSYILEIRGDAVKMVTIRMEDFLYDFYEKVGRQANLPPEQVMADALFKLRGN